MEGIGRVALREVAAVERVAPELAEVWPEQRAAVVEDYDPRVVDDAFAGIYYVLAEERVLAGPEVGAVAADLLQYASADDEVAAGVVVDVAPPAL